MFTGIIEDLGTIASITPFGDGRRLRVRTRIPLAEVRIGDSIAVDGACLTVETTVGDVFEVVAGRETLERTTVGTFVAGTPVHLERALRVDARLDGHLVQGHVDGVGTVVSVAEQAESWVLWVDVGEPLARFVAAKGSVALDGVSLTVNEVDGARCRINVIPHTARVTKLARRHGGDPVNVEVDVLARYVDRMLGFGAPSSGVTREFLERHGFR